MQFLTSCFHLNNRYFLLSVEYLFFIWNVSLKNACILTIDTFKIWPFCTYTHVYYYKRMFHWRVKCWIQYFNVKLPHDFHIFITKYWTAIIIPKIRTHYFQCKNVYFCIYLIYNGLEFSYSKCFKNHIWVLLLTILQITIQRNFNDFTIKRFL